MNSAPDMLLELKAFEWLRFERKCPVVLLERNPMGHSRYFGRPDVFGVTKDRYTIEIEVKRTLSDFRANRRKSHVETRDNSLYLWPRLYYYMVPPDLVGKVFPEVQPWAGLITLACPKTGKFVRVVKCPKANNSAPKLSIMDCRRLVRQQSNLVASLLRRVNELSFRLGQRKGNK